MNKTQLKKEISLKTVWNKTKQIGDYTVAWVGWHDNQWKVDKANVSFETLKERNYKPLAEFYYQEDLINYLLGKV